MIQVIRTRAPRKRGFQFVLWLPLLAFGCGGGGDFGETVTVPQEKRTPIDDPLASGRTLRFPADSGFNVADAQRYSTGEARADSAADPSGRAQCQASAAGGGSAWSEFQLGHVLDHRGSQPLEASVAFHVNYRFGYESRIEPALTNEFALKAYIADSNKRVLRRVVLASLEPGKGPQSWQGRQSSAFDVTLEPGLAYHLVLAGRVKVDGVEDRTTSAEIEVASLELEVSPRIATAANTRPAGN